MRTDMRWVVCALVAVAGGACGTRGEPKELQQEERPSHPEQERPTLKSCIREHLPAKDPTATDWVVSGNTFVSVFEVCSKSPSEERQAVFRAVAGAMTRQTSDLTELIIVEAP